jgi:aryl-alcohol dehydrogenase-like predicted oxidoreductase
MTFGAGADEATSFDLMDRFTELGGTFLDTANVYNGGRSEEIVGRWIKERGVRDRVVLATKVYGATGTGPNEAGLSRLHIHRAVEASLRRLQTDVIDLYQIHRWDFEAPPEETLEALNDLVRQGKVRYIGCSNLKGWHLTRYLALAEQHHWSRFVSIQPLYSALNRSIENEVLSICANEGLGVIPYNPLAGGVLTGKYKRGEPLPEDTRLSDSEGYRERYYTETTFDIVEAFVEAAAAHGITPAQLALAWVLAEPRITSPIIGARNLRQLNDTLGRLDFRLTPEERAALPSVLPGRWVGKDPVYDRA